MRDHKKRNLFRSIAALAILAALVSLTGCAAATSATEGASSITEPTPTQTTISTSTLDSLQASYDTLAASLSGTTGIAVTPAGAGDTTRSTVSLGTWTTGYAWSTSKVPVAIASLRDDDSQANRELTDKAITESDNDAASAQRDSLGSNDEAATKVTAVMRDMGDDTAVPTGDDALDGYGYLNWSLANSSVFVGSLANSTDTAAQYVLADMGNIISSESWGLGTITIGSVSFKGGWAPDDADSGYLTRQLGVIRLGDNQCWGVAIASQDSEGFDAAQQDMTQLAQWLQENITEFPAGTCPALPGS